MVRRAGIIVSTIKASTLGWPRRFDAEYYRSDFLELLQKQSADSKHQKTLKELCEKIDVGFVGAMTQAYTDNGIPLLQTKNIKEFLVDFTDLVYIKDEFHKQLSKSQIFPGDVLIARSGSIGNAAIITSEDLQPLNSSDIVILHPNNMLNGYYLCAYINSKFGQAQIERLSSGGVQGHINLAALEKVVIPLLPDNFQNRIERIIKSANSKRNESKQLYADAENLLASELGLDKVDLSESLFNVQTVSDVLKSKRLDAEHYNKKYERLESLLKKYSRGFESLGDICLPPVNGVEIREYQETGIPYLRVGDLYQVDIKEDTVVHIDPESAATVKSKVSLKNGDVLMSRSGSLGMACVVSEKWKHAINSSHLIRLRLAKSDIDPYYLALFLNTTAGVEQIRKYSNGGVQPEINQPSLKKLIVPILSGDVQLEVKKLILKSHKSRDEAKSLLAEAKEEVEKMIEGR